VAGITDDAIEIAVDHSARPRVRFARPSGSLESRRLAFDQHADSLAWATWDERRKLSDLRFLDTKTGRVNASLADSPIDYQLINGTFDASGNLFAIHNNYGSHVILWDLRHKVLRRNDNQFPSGFVLSIALSKDGRLLATGDGSNCIEIRDAGSFELRSRLVSHLDDVIQLEFSPDGRRLASGDRSGAVKLWDVAGGDELLDLEGLTHPIDFLRFSRNGQTLVSATRTEPGRFVLWHSNPTVKFGSNTKTR